MPQRFLDSSANYVEADRTTAILFDFIIVAKLDSLHVR